MVVCLSRADKMGIDTRLLPSKGNEWLFLIAVVPVFPKRYEGYDLPRHLPSLTQDIH